MNSFCSSAIPYLKPSVARNNSSLQLSPAESPALTDLGNDLLVVYVVDDGKQLVWVQNRHLKEEKLSVRDLHKLSIDNLQRVADQKLKVMQYGPVYGAFLEGNFEASLILLDQFWDVQFAHLTKSHFTVTIPARDILAFCDSESAEGISTLREIAARPMISNDHLISTSLYTRDGTLWRKAPPAY